MKTQCTKEGGRELWDVPQVQIAACEALGEIVGEIGEIIGVFEDFECLEENSTYKYVENKANKTSNIH